MARTRTSDKETNFKALYEQHRNELFAYVYNIIGDQPKAEDMVQDIFITVWNRFEDLDIAAPRAYLFQAARFQCAKHFRANKFTHVQLDAIADVVSRHELDFSKEETEALMEQVASKADSLLPEKCKQVFELRFYHQLTNKEIAEKLGLSVSTVENQINKALKLLRLSLSQQAGILVVVATVGLG